MIDEVLEMRSLAAAAGRKPTSFHDAEGANDNQFRGDRLTTCSLRKVANLFDCRPGYDSVFGKARIYESSLPANCDWIRFWREGCRYFGRAHRASSFARGKG